VEFYPLGYLGRRAEILVQERDKPIQVPFYRTSLDCSSSPIRPDQVRDDLGFSGFRLLYRINRPD
jgi:glucan biosynthesis protein